MSRYYFHSVTEDGLFEDDVGVEVKDLDLYREAMKALFELSNECDADGEEWPILRFMVVDDAGTTVLDLPIRAAQGRSN